MKQRLAKLTQPTVTGSIERTRLFSAMDRRGPSNAVWVCGPPGSGKTTLVSSYVKARRYPCIWYQIDKEDGDASSFFYYLSLAAPGRNPKLPLLTPEYLPNLTGFARRFFRQLYSLLPAEGALALDGLHELPTASPLLGALFDAAMELPSGATLFMISRHPPHAALARDRAHGNLVVLDWDALKLSCDEVVGIAAGQTVLREGGAERLLEACGGWVAGLRLILQGGGSDAPAPSDSMGLDPQGLSNYFFSEVLARSSSETRKVLIETSVLPDISGVFASAMTGLAQAEEVLQQLCEQQMFIERRGDGVYRYHALFRKYLLDVARRERGVLGMRELQSRAASLLAANGMREAAIQLHIDAGDWLVASRLILEVAPGLLIQGRNQTLREWIRRLPAFMIEGTPRLLYSLGAAEASVSPRDARGRLVRAWEQFHAEANGLGQAYTIASIIETFYFEYDSYVGLEIWISRLKDLIGSGLSFSTAEAELRVFSMLQTAMTLVRPADPFLPRCSEHIFGLLERRMDVNQRVVAAALLLNYCDWFAVDRCAQLVSLINPELTSKGLVPFHAVWWLLAEAHHWRFQGESERVEDTLARLHDVANRAGLMVPESASMILELWGAGDGDGSPSEERLAARLVASTKSGRRQESILSHLVAAEWRLRRRDSSVALDLARTAVDLAERTGQVMQRLTGLIIMAVAEGELDLQADAQRHLHEAYSIIPGEGAHKLRFQLLLVEAFLRLRVPDSPEAARLLAEALALARERGYVDAFVWLPWKMSELLSFALTSGIEVECATRLIRRRRLVAGENSPDSWPWPVRILTLGSFSILLDGVPLAFSGKSPRRPLELLKGLIARGGRGVDAQNLWESLWPEAEGDAAAGSFAMALHRLRKLLKEDGALTLDEGKLSLNSHLCQVDAWLFESLCDQSTREDIRTTRQASLERALRLYRGQFLDDETVHAWMLPARDRFRSKMLTAVKTLAGIHAQDNRWDQVRQVYERALEVDHLYEPLYQGLIESLLEVGERGEAMDVYRRCRDMLAMTFGAMPSERTELLRQGASRTATS